MPGVQQKSKLMQSIGPIGKVVKERLAAGVDSGFQAMPPGVREGIAKVDDVEIAQVKEGKQNAGKWYFRASAVATEPEYINDNGTKVKIRGKKTSVFQMLMEQKSKAGEVWQTKDEAVDFAINHLLMMGAGELLTEDCDLEEVAKAVKDRAADASAPPLLIKFSTRLQKVQIDPATKKPKINPNTGKPYDQKVQEFWHEYDGDAASYEAPAPTNADGTAAAQDQTATAEFNEFSELETLVEKANNDDGDAQSALREKAKELGVTDEQLDDETQYPSWESIAEFVKAGVAVEPEKEPWKPAVGPCKYKGKKHEIIAVQGRSKTVHLKGVVDKAKKPIAVKFDEVTEA